MFRITLKNYRCFSDEKPGIIDIGPGFTAFIGANNSGKSSYLRFFVEFRRFIANISDAYSPRWIEGIGPLDHVEDWTEVFHNGNNRELRIEIEDKEPINGEIAKIEYTLQRNRPHVAWVDTWLKINGETLKASQGNSQNMIIIRGQSMHPPRPEKFSDFCRTISQPFYIGPFRNAISEGSGNYFDITIGTSFIGQWDGWKTGAGRQANEAAQRVADDIAHIFDFRRFEINATNDKKSLQVIINGKPYRLRELGAGLAQFIVVFGNVAIRQPGLLLIDEPELNLHPSLQIDFLTSLASYASYGVAFASHSVGLARAVSDRIYTFQKRNDSALVKPFEQIPNFAEFAGEMSFSSFKEIGCDRILLVEGVTEVKALQQFLRVLRKDHTTVLLPLGGSQMIRGGVQQELQELGRLSSKVAVLIDSERENATATLPSERSAFIADCQALNFKVHVTDKRAFENYLCDRAVKEEKGPGYRALNEFERLRDVNPGWSKSDNWRIARRMTKDEVLLTDIGNFLNQL